MKLEIKIEIKEKAIVVFTPENDNDVYNLGRARFGESAAYFRNSKMERFEVPVKNLLDCLFAYEKPYN